MKKYNLKLLTQFYISKIKIILIKKKREILNMSQLLRTEGVLTRSKARLKRIRTCGLFILDEVGSGSGPTGSQQGFPAHLRFLSANIYHPDLQQGL